jgi:hypothetical protein
MRWDSHGATEGWYIREWSNRLLASYLVPLVTRGSRLDSFAPTQEESTILEQHRASAGTDMPTLLQSWYDGVSRPKP